MNAVRVKHRPVLTSVATVGLVLGVLAFGAGSVEGAWQLVWSDEFNQPDGSSPDPTKWGFNTGGGGWGNNELENYTSRTNNARIQNGQLVIEADKENYGGSSYTSARMLTQGKWSWTYGRVEASIKLPRGQGIWPAFWMLGTNISSVSWPTCGEIDIMENIGKTSDQGTTHGTIHGPQGSGDYNGGAGVGGTYTLPGGAVLGDTFHLFAIEWTNNQIKWFMDSVQYFTATPASLPSGGTWVFTAPQFILLNLAVGGNWPGNPDTNTVFPQQMLVDYVRVYTYVAAPPSAPTGLSAAQGSGKAFLGWDNSTSGATGYNIKRAPASGGPYTTIGTAATNSFVDATVSTCASYYYVVSATNSAGESTNSSEAALPLGSYALAVNSGGGASAQFVADSGFSGGAQASPSTAAIDTSAVTNPAPQAVYQSERYGNFSYTFTGLTAGLSYKVRLHFAEFYWTSVGQRRFNVAINGTQVLTNFDIIAAAGAPNKATIQEFMAAPTNGQIVIQYTTVVDNAKSSGIEVLLPTPSAPTAGNNGPLWSGMTLNLNASAVPGAAYAWTGPGGFRSTSQNPSIAAATPAASGVYAVTVTVGSCSSPPSTTTVVVNPPAVLSMSASNNNLRLSWPNGTLQSAPSLTGQWSAVSGATSPWSITPVAPQMFYRIKLQ